MFGKLVKFSLPILVAFLLGALTTASIIHSFEQARKLSSIEEIQSNNNISEDLPRNVQESIKSSRNSAVNIMSMSLMGVISSSTGTYISSNGSYYVLTVAHGIAGPCELTRIMINDEMTECVEYVEVNMEQDYAIIRVEKIPNITPIKIPRDLPKNNYWDEALSLHNKTYYTGFPNGIGPLTFRGDIVGYDNHENIYIHSFAWPGSSGSGVFNAHGKLIGYVMAISVGSTDIGVDVLEDIVIVVPLYKIDWSVLK